MSGKTLSAVCKVASVLTAGATVVTSGVVDTAIKNAAGDCMPSVLVGIARGMVSATISTMGVCSAMSLWKLQDITKAI